MIGVIIGSTLGGLLVIAILFVVLLWLRWNRRRNTRVFPSSAKTDEQQQHPQAIEGNEPAVEAESDVTDNSEAAIGVRMHDLHPILQAEYIRHKTQHQPDTKLQPLNPNSKPRPKPKPKPRNDNNAQTAALNTTMRILADDTDSDSQHLTKKLHVTKRRQAPEIPKKPETIQLQGNPATTTEVSTDEYSISPPETMSWININDTDYLEVGPETSSVTEINDDDWWCTTKL